MGRIIAIDYGQKRVGIAVTDSLCMIANSLITVHSAELFDFLGKYFSTEQVDLILVGEPRNMNNTPSESARFIEPFVKKLCKTFPEIPVKRVDERFTSKMAFRTMIEAGLKKKDRQNKELVDSLSATIILQSFMESNEYIMFKNSAK